jgi:hypothetical protein
MTPIVTRCGFRCDLCPAFHENVGGPEDQKRVSDGWFNPSRLITKPRSGTRI